MPLTGERKKAYNKEYISSGRYLATEQRPERKEYRKILYSTKKAYKDIDFECRIGGCKNTNIHLHHQNYEEPLNVIPLCGEHHREEHKVAV